MERTTIIKDGSTVVTFMKRRPVLLNGLKSQRNFDFKSLFQTRIIRTLQTVRARDLHAYRRLRVCHCSLPSAAKHLPLLTVPFFRVLVAWLFFCLAWLQFCCGHDIKDMTNDAPIAGSISRLAGHSLVQVVKVLMGISAKSFGKHEARDP
jgi:hypothetical protein